MNFLSQIDNTIHRHHIWYRKHLDLTPVKVKSAIKVIEKGEGRDINYTVLSYDEFYYRLSVRDRFITEILNGKYTVIVDKDSVLLDQK